MEIGTRKEKRRKRNLSLFSPPLPPHPFFSLSSQFPHVRVRSYFSSIHIRDIIRTSRSCCCSFALVFSFCLFVCLFLVLFFCFWFLRFIKSVKRAKGIRYKNHKRISIHNQNKRATMASFYSDLLCYFVNGVDQSFTVGVRGQSRLVSTFHAQGGLIPLIKEQNNIVK